MHPQPNISGTQSDKYLPPVRNLCQTSLEHGQTNILLLSATLAKHPWNIVRLISSSCMHPQPNIPGIWSDKNPPPVCILSQTSQEHYQTNKYLPPVRNLSQTSLEHCQTNIFLLYASLAKHPWNMVRQKSLSCMHPQPNFPGTLSDKYLPPVRNLSQTSLEHGQTNILLLYASLAKHPWNMVRQTSSSCPHPQPNIPGTWSDKYPSPVCILSQTSLEHCRTNIFLLYASLAKHPHPLNKVRQRSSSCPHPQPNIPGIWSDKNPPHVCILSKTSLEHCQTNIFLLCASLAKHPWNMVRQISPSCMHPQPNIPGIWSDKYPPHVCILSQTSLEHYQTNIFLLFATLAKHPWNIIRQISSSCPQPQPNIPGTLSDKYLPPVRNLSQTSLEHGQTKIPLLCASLAKHPWNIIRQISSSCPHPQPNILIP